MSELSSETHLQRPSNHAHCSRCNHCPRATTCNNIPKASQSICNGAKMLAHIFLVSKLLAIMIALQRSPKISQAPGTRIQAKSSMYWFPEPWWSPLPHTSTTAKSGMLRCNAFIFGHAPLNYNPKLRSRHPIKLYVARVFKGGCLQVFQTRLPPILNESFIKLDEDIWLASKVLGCSCPVFLSLDVLFICDLWSTSLWTFGFPIRRVARCLFHTWSTKHVKHASPLYTYKNAKQNNVRCKARAFASAYAMQQLLSSKKRADRVQADEQALQSLCSSDYLIVSNTKYLPRFDLGRYLPLLWSKVESDKRACPSTAMIQQCSCVCAASGFCKDLRAKAFFGLWI